MNERSCEKVNFLTLLWHLLARKRLRKVNRALSPTLTFESLLTFCIQFRSKMNCLTILTLFVLTLTYAAAKTRKTYQVYTRYRRKLLIIVFYFAALIAYLFRPNGTRIVVDVLLVSIVSTIKKRLWLASNESDGFANCITITIMLLVCKALVVQISLISQLKPPNRVLVCLYDSCYDVSGKKL